MALKRQQGIGLPHPLAVIGHLDHPAPTVRDLDGDPCTPSVEAVVDELLHHGRWTLHDLAGGDPADHLSRQDLDFADAGDAHHSALPSPRQPSGRAPSQDAWSPVPQVMSRWVEGAGRRAGLHATAGELATGRTSSDLGQLIFGQLGLIGV